MRDRPAAQVVLLTALGTIVGTIVVLTVPWLPEDASRQAGDIFAFYNVLAAVSCFVFSLVAAILIVSVANFRRRHAEDREGAPVHGDTRLEIVWTAIPAVIVAAIAAVSALVLADLDESSAADRVVKVTGQQFAFSFDYPEHGVQGAAELHLIEDQPYVFEMTSKDVIHSFWVPDFAMKKDIVPGITTRVHVTPTRSGSFPLVCAELCGLGHATMRARVVVESEAFFNKWIATQPADAESAGTQSDATGQGGK